ncbi:MAG TPA: hypothetical protein VIS27_01230 [Yeosuana sp.]
MIKFFRKIRQNSIKENKVTNYLKYAIGEIILVVIGILIALQINNWNTDRQVKNDNKLFLKKMLTDLNQNKARMDELAYETRYDGKYPSYQHAINQCDTILKLTYKGLKISDIEFISNSKFDAASPQLNLQKSTYEELLNTGKLYTIGSDSLINAINNYFKLCESEEMYNISNNENYTRAYNSMDKGLGILLQDYQLEKANFDINNYPWFFHKTSEEYLNIRLGMSRMLEVQKLNLFKMMRIKKQSDILIRRIQKTLKK